MHKIIYIYVPVDIYQTTKFKISKAKVAIPRCKNTPLQVKALKMLQSTEALASKCT